MDARLALVPDADLERDAESLFRAASVMRGYGMYGLAARLRSTQVRLDAELLLRRSKAMRDADRQLSLAPPGAYSERV
jgi:hypothetical protein